MGTESGSVGLLLGSVIPPEQIPGAALQGEEAGFSEIWLAEDYFYTGGISGATAALAATKTIPVGTGIVSALVRHPALLAMEASTLARIYPGRVRIGIGLGLPSWIAQMGLTPPSQLGALRECVRSVRALLAGEELTDRGDVFGFEKVQLTYPVTDQPVPIYMGALRPKMLRLSGELCDGTVLAILAGPKYVRWARAQLEAGAIEAGRDPAAHRLVTFAIYCVGSDSKRAKDAVRGLVAWSLALTGPSPLIGAYDGSERLAELIALGGAEAVAREMPSEWMEQLAIAGDPDECVAKIQQLHEAGASSVALFPLPAEMSSDMIRMTAKEVLPRL
jgi:5,10-methylenetetrahydromethanopterin reductase